MESQTVDTLQNGDAQRNGHTGLLFIYQAVDIWKKGMHLKSGHMEKGMAPKKQTANERYRNSKVDIWGFLGARASDTISHRLERMQCENIRQKK